MVVTPTEEALARLLGQRRMSAPAALANAVEDALAPLGVRVEELPMTRERIVNWIEARRRG